jgi:hypothetical protein
MPGFNRTGPEGKGSITGRGMGRCTNYGRSLKRTADNSSDEQNETVQENLKGRGFGFGRAGSGRGRARGMGRQNRFRTGF